MRNLQQNPNSRNRARLERRVYHRNLSRHACAEAAISVATYGDGFGVASTLTRAGHNPVRDFILLKPDERLNEERAWLIGYQRICAWLDEYAPDMPLFIIPTDEQTDRR